MRDRERNGAGQFIRENERCSVDECQNPYYSRGYCSKHYSRFTKTGDPLKTPTGRMRGVYQICAVPLCNRTDTSKGYCFKHYRLWRRWGVPEKQRGKHGRYRFINSGGYVRICKPGHPNSNSDGWILEHRFVMSEHLGRPLLPTEIVHHRNGKRQQNTINNLELLTRASLPPGHAPTTCPNCGHVFTSFQFVDTSDSVIHE